MTGNIPRGGLKLHLESYNLILFVSILSRNSDRRAPADTERKCSIVHLQVFCKAMPGASIPTKPLLVLAKNCRQLLNAYRDVRNHRACSPE